MPKPEKSAKSSARVSSKAKAQASSKSSARGGTATLAKPAKSSSKLSAASSSKLPAPSAKSAAAKPAAGSMSKSAPAAQAKAAASSSSTKSSATAVAKPASSKSSAKIVVAPTKSRASERFEKALEKPIANLKSPFTKDELSKWREQLLQRRNEISSDIAGLEKDAMEAEDGHTTPNHIAERGSDADLQDVSLGIAGEEKDIIWQIDRALRKIDATSPLPYGLCEFTKEPISRNRLQLIPWTPLSIEGANYMEENNMKVEDLLVDG